MTDTAQDLRNQCKAIADTLANPGLVTEDGGDLDYDELFYGDGEEWDREETGTFYDKDGTEVEVRQMSGFDYLQDALDIEYRVGSDRKTYKSGEVLVAFGGPNIWIDTGSKEVIGAWWGDSCRVSYAEDNLGLDDALQELFNC